MLVVLLLAGCTQPPVTRGVEITPAPLPADALVRLVADLDATGGQPDPVARARLAAEARRLGGVASPPVQGALDRLATSLEQGEGPAWWLAAYWRGLVMDALLRVGGTSLDQSVPFVPGDGRAGLVLGSASPQVLPGSAPGTSLFVLPVPRAVAVDVWRWDEQECSIFPVPPGASVPGAAVEQVLRPATVPLDVRSVVRDSSAAEVTVLTPPGAGVAVLVVPAGVQRGTWLTPDPGGVHQGRVAVPPGREGPRDRLRVLVLGGPCLVLADEEVAGVSLPG